MARLGVIAVCLALLCSGTATADGPALVVVVNSGRTDRIDIHALARIYLRTRRFWDDGTPIVPLNLEAGSREREAFTRRVLGGGGDTWLATYWNERYFHGVFPPTVVSSSASVKRWLATEPGAIGYFDARDVDDSVRVILKLDD
jgi:ABC-type phosphate transport system substrate-binding protein